MYCKLLLVSCFHSLIGGSGWFDWTSLNLLEPFVKEFLNSSITSHYGTPLDQATLPWVWAAATSAYLVGNLPGAYLLNCLPEKIGRRSTAMVVKNLAHIFSSLVQFVAVQLNSAELFIFGRICSGIPSALTFLLPIYLSECSPVKSRGIMSSIPCIGLQIWCALAMALGLPQLLGTEQLWSFVLLFPVLPCSIHLLATPLLHESPKHLFITKQDRARAVKSVQFYHGPHSDVDEVLKEFENESQMSKVAQVRMKEIFTVKHYLYPLIICCFASAAVAVDGIYVSNQYSVEILLSGLSHQQASMYSVFLVHVPAICMTTVSLFLIERTGRRILLFSGLAICIFGQILVLLGGLFASTTAAVFSVSGFVLIMLGDSVGPSIVRSIIAGELCVHSIRSFTVGAQYICECVLATIVTFSYPPLNGAIGAWAMTVLLLSTFTCTVVLFFSLPETKNREVAEIVKKWQPT